MKIFGFPLSPFVRKVHVVAAEKGIAVETVLANPMAPEPEFLAASPFRKIPALQDGDFTLADSTAIATYLDALQPDPPLLPAAAKARATAIWFEEVADTILTPAGGPIVFNRLVGPKFLGLPGDEDAARAGEVALAPILDYIETAAPAQGWLAGDQFSIGDIAIASVFATLRYVGVGPDAVRHPNTAAWFARVEARPAWQAVLGREAAIFKERVSA
ncbi:glutathione S-transferase family protein [Novosphingobium lentum]|uniref:glutathione S-transferase family protein n=1 Tax=Novosphingobium lentum TaxID=145287 RepID=UPI000836B305|nr:glutathione S-transferase family protein [Novosphingobium lentum]